MFLETLFPYTGNVITLGNLKSLKFVFSFLSCFCFLPSSHPLFLFYFLSVTSLLRHNSHIIQFTYLKCIIPWVLVHSRSHANTSTINFRVSSSAQGEALLSSCTPNPVLPPAPGSRSVTFPLLNLSDKWKNIIQGLSLLYI